MPMNDAQPSYIRISGGQVRTFDGENRRIARGEVWVRGGRPAYRDMVVKTLSGADTIERLAKLK